jgi:mRNA-degrading endonuclease RelE of RelBE toxin-antitoxin system
MKVKISKRFVKDTQKITDTRVLIKIRQLLAEAETLNSLFELANVTEMSGYPNFYRIKFDYRYRVGIYFDGETIEFLRVGNREDFYKRFP